MMKSVIDKFVEVLAAPPDPILSSSSMGAKKPSGGSDIPAIAISLTIEGSRGSGLGRFIRAGDTVVQNTSIIEVNSTPETFSNDLRSLYIQPLPLKKNPASVENKFTEKDIQVRNVTDTAHPIAYRMVVEPGLKEEYKLDVPQAQIIFGKAQTAGDKLEMTHWTVTWRDEILGDRYNGMMILEIGASSFNEVDGISRRLQNKVKSNRAELRQRGFMKFQPASLEPAENILHAPPVGSPFSVWKQKLGYKFTFETEEGGELSSGIPIKRIDVDMDEDIVEAFSIPRINN